ncbi:MAG: glutathione S-transferase family protein [Myxococcota bacterium]
MTVSDVKPTFVLHTTRLSANGRKPLAVSHHLGLAPEIRGVNVYAGEGRSPAYLALNPLGKIPTLVDGDFTLSESNAIVVYVSEAHGGLRLFSREPRARADILRWLFWESSHWQPSLSLVLAPIVGHRLLPKVVPAPASAPDWAHAQLAPQLAFLEAQLAGRAFLTGSELTLADFAVGGMTTYFRAADFPWSAWPNIRAWCGRLDALEAWQASADPLWS